MYNFICVGSWDFSFFWYKGNTTKLCTTCTEFTTMAGRRLREAVKETLISSGNGEFDDENVVIAGLTNAYSQYISTFEEYEQQRYEVLMHLLLTRTSLYL